MKPRIKIVLKHEEQAGDAWIVRLRRVWSCTLSTGDFEVGSQGRTIPEALRNLAEAYEVAEWEEA